MPRWLIGLLLVASIVYMGWSLVFSDHGYRVYRAEVGRLAELKRQLARLRTERKRLAQEILRLRHDPKALEELVHRELGYVHPDEYVLIMPESAQTPEGKRP